MEMKRLFAYLIAALMLSLLLCGCGGTMDDGNVAASPWPDMTHQVTPAPTAALSPLPDLNMENNAGEPGGEAENGMSSARFAHISRPDRREPITQSNRPVFRAVW